MFITKGALRCGFWAPVITASSMLGVSCGGRGWRSGRYELPPACGSSSSSDEFRVAVYNFQICQDLFCKVEELLCQILI
jgi:hypothetical protein